MAAVLPFIQEECKTFSRTLYLFGSLLCWRRTGFLAGLPLVGVLVGVGRFGLTLGGTPDQPLNAQVLGHLEKPVQLGSGHVDLARVDKVHDGLQVLGTDSAQIQQRPAVAVVVAAVAVEVTGSGLQEFSQHGT